MQELLQLPLQVQATLVAGYLGYIVLKRDYRKTEKLSDMWMLILFLGLPTALLIQFWDSSWAYASVLLGPLLALIWTKCIDKCWNKLLYDNKISNKVNEGDVWKTISSNKNVAPTQISLTTKDGAFYLCQDTTQFNGEEFASFVMDDDGIAFYVTDFVNPGESTWNEVEDVQLGEDLGSLLTYFPRENIRLLEMRFKAIK